DVPPGSKSLALIVEDPDVPRILKADGVFVHWIRWNLAPESSGVPPGQASPGTSYITGTPFIPPCPPDSTHRYVFKLFALDTVLTDAKISSAADLRRAMEGHVIDRSQLVGRYRRPIGWFAFIGAVVLGVLSLATFLLYLCYRVIRPMVQRKNAQDG